MLQFWSAASPALRGILLMVASTVGFSLMHTIVRHLSDHLHPLEIAFFRNAFGLITFAPWLIRYGLAPFRTKRFPLHLVRSVLNCVAMFAFFTGLALTPIAEVTALGFTAPIFAAVLGVVFLGERFKARRWCAIALGFLGTLIILRPGFQATDPGALLVLFSAVLWAATMIVIKILGRTESSITITGYMNILLTLLSVGPAIYVWQTPAPEDWIWLLLLGLLGTLAQIALAQSLKEAESSLVMPFDFLKLIWAASLGYLLFAEVPDLFVWIGGGVIFASSTYLAYREGRAAARGSPDERP